MCALGGNIFSLEAGRMKEARTGETQYTSPVMCNTIDCLGETVNRLLIHCVELVQVEYQLHGIWFFGISTWHQQSREDRGKVRSRYSRQRGSFLWGMI